MYEKFDISFLVRCLSLSLLCIIPGLYIILIIPTYILPFTALVSILFAAAMNRINIRFIPSFLALLLFLPCAYFLLIFFFGLIHSTFSDTLFLHVAVSFWIVCVTAVCSFISTYLFIRFIKWKYIEPLLILSLLCLFCWSQGNHSLTIFSHPIKASAFAFIILLLQFFQLASINNKFRNSIIQTAIFLPVLTLSVFCVIQMYNKLSVANNGGLIQPTLFKFDFSPYLSLQNEIKINDNLVLIVRTKQEFTNTLLRRVYLSGWNKRKGFFESNPPDELPQYNIVPKKPQEIPHQEYQLRTPVEQEYFIINFDPSSLISMDYPINVTPYKIWNSAKFSGAYSVTSNTTGFMPFELLDSPPPTGNSGEGLSASDLLFYTSLDSDTRSQLRPLATSITQEIPTYYDKILALTSFLKEGDYRYSLKPGIAPDGDQLGYFLFTSKKGYCTYFAFSLCLMLRSIGIPSRIAAGFFIQPDSGSLDYYPIRSNMAHAWVEVFFPNYGWISFDPTTTQLSVGEEVSTGNTSSGDDFFQLLTEIIDNRKLLSTNSEEMSTYKPFLSFSSFLKTLLSSVQNGIVQFAIYCLLFVFLLFYLLPVLFLKYSSNSRKKTVFLSKKIYQSLSRSGKKRNSNQSREAFILSLGNKAAEDFFRIEQKARYAPDFTEEEFNKAFLLSKTIFNEMKKTRKKLVFFFLVFILFSSTLNSESTTHDPSQHFTIEKLSLRAKEAIASENWELAISILSEGIASFPSEPAFHYTLGSLYFDKTLYGPAFNELYLALTLGYSGSEIYSRLSDTDGYLNKDEEALIYLKKYLAIVPDDLYAWSNYGWLCYKTHRLDEGISTLHHIIDTYGPDGNIYVGLGNLYTAAFNYPQAKTFYTLAITLSETRKQPYLTSIYYYNRSILEEVFYNFEKAYADTLKSLDYSARSSGYLMQGELELRRLNYTGALSQYQKAFSLDSTPLATLGLAETLLEAGYTEESSRFIKTIQSKTDFSWISNYGTTIDQYKSDLFKLQKDLFMMRLHTEQNKVIHSFPTLLQKLWNIYYDKYHLWYFDTLSRIQNTKVAQKYELSEKEYNTVNDQELYINSFYFMALNKWQNIAVPYLERAKIIESGFIPAAKPSYLYEQAKLKHDIALFDESINTLDPVWERQYISKALAERILITPKKDSFTKRQYSTHLFSLNPTAFTYYKINFPVSFTSSNTLSRPFQKEVKKIQNALVHSSFEKDNNSAYCIDIRFSEETITVSLINRNNNFTAYTQDLHKTTNTAKEICDFVNTFSTSTFKTNLGI